MDRNPCVGYTGNAIHPAMRGFPVAIPARAFRSGVLVHRGVIQYFMVFQQGCMTPEAILLHHTFALLLDKNDLGFFAKGENGGMPEAILGLEIVFIDRIVMGNMAIVAVGPFPVRTVIPGGILWGHDVAVHTSSGVIRQVGVCPGNVK